MSGEKAEMVSYTSTIMLYVLISVSTIIQVIRDDSQGGCGRMNNARHDLTAHSNPGVVEKGDRTHVVSSS